ncbi:GMC oxidoreductase [Gloeothece verrucosa]|uniref:GMC oxidoreductase n=1 Tax=Gloeothece verrucosa (strain PCC 7822) TaxID=497965 RepID=E0UC55_GLOV7|nr:GMC family oxidoreductase [Gloeothece verrucosa]ADN16393.1 GMC oxidoreductase [Gloeothece verrucosa PCC 7822]
MIFDAGKLPRDETLETEICIIGTGPAGITLAKEFIGGDFRVILLESGTFEFDQATQSLCDGEIGEPLRPYHLRARQFGGTCNKWGIQIGNGKQGIRYAPFDEIDFEKRDWLPYSGWPFSKSHLDPFYEKAHSFCQIGPYNYEATTWEDNEGRQIKFKGNQVITTVFQFGARDVFLQNYLKDIKAAPNITTYLKANVVNIETNDTANLVLRVKVATLNGNQFWVKAKTFILATGGLENARLLLLSNQTQKTGLGNQHDLVGRFFMDHFMIYCGMLLPSTKKIFDQTIFYDLRCVKGIPIMGKLALTQQTMREQQLLNTATYLIPRYKTYHLQRMSLRALEILQSSLKQKKIYPNMARYLNRLIGGKLTHIVHAIPRKITRRPFYYASIAEGGWSSLPNKEQEFALFEIQHLVEQAPDFNNRVRLSEELDLLGYRKIKIERRLRDIDIKSIQKTQKILQKEFALSGFGELFIDEEELDFQRTLPLVPGSSHHIGTTRMHLDPKQGVVNENCQVHGISNLFIAGSSVFPTGSYANPTLTIIALAIRLAAHIKTLM